MTSRRERKAIEAFAAAEKEANGGDATHDETTISAAAANDVTAAAAGARPSQSDESAAAARPSPSSSRCWSLLQLLSTLLVFLSVFVSFSYATTGTPLYGVSAAQGAAALRRHVDAAKIRLQEAAGLRSPPMFAKYDQPNTGYGGVTNKKNKGKKQQPAAPQTATGIAVDSVPGVAPPQSPTPSTAGSDNDHDTNVAATDVDADADADDDVVIEARPAERDPNALYLTLEQLSKYDGSDGGRIFLAVYGRVFDVSAGRDFYGPGANYANLAAKDSSRAFATNCYNNDDLHDLRGLSKEQFKGINHWYKFYSEHERYRAVGWLDLPDIPNDAPLPNDKC